MFDFSTHFRLREGVPGVGVRSSGSSGLRSAGLHLAPLGCICCPRWEALHSLLTRHSESLQGVTRARAHTHTLIYARTHAHTHTHTGRLTHFLE